MPRVETVASIEDVLVARSGRFIREFFQLINAIQLLGAEVGLMECGTLVFDGERFVVYATALPSYPGQSVRMYWDEREEEFVVVGVGAEREACAAAAAETRRHLGV